MSLIPGSVLRKDRQEAIFERFVQADLTDSKVHQGAGLGLSITRAYVEMLGGRIWLESVASRGSAFFFTLPYRPVREEADTQSPVAPARKAAECAVPVGVRGCI